MPFPFVFSKPWRTVNWERKRQLEDSVKNLKPSNPDIGNVRILLHGVVGSGKSSFINSLNSVFQRRVITKVKAAPSAATSCTKTYKSYVIKIPSGTLGITIADFMGLEEKAENIHPDDFRNALHGHLPDGYELNGNEPLSLNDQRYILNPSDAEKTHCLVCVVSANSISRMLPATIDKMKLHLKEASKLGIPCAVIMTMGDVLCPAVKWDVQSIYMSKEIKKKVEECSSNLQVPMTCIFPVKNYSDEIETNNDMDVLLLLALRQIVHFANDYAEELGGKKNKK